jgi:hypothetical protein
MYSTCIFCHSSLGKNESIEHFPVGRRLAFDAEHGRLWVVCRSCERWNLTPIEDRWEAIEECERAFSNTKMRVSTDNIGLARLRDGTDLVRIGQPMRPEMAAWRYGDQFGRRRRKQLLYTGAAVSLIAGTATMSILHTVGAIGISVGSVGLWSSAFNIHNAYQGRRTRTRITVADVPHPMLLHRGHLAQAHLIQDASGWGIGFSYRGARHWDFWNRSKLREKGDSEVTLVGEAARRVTAKLLPAINYASAPKEKVQEAVAMLGEFPDANALFDRWTGYGATRRARLVLPASAPTKNVDAQWRKYPIAGLPLPARLALEMASHEDAERRALEGELAALEDEWREAEEIAAIADNMFAPDTSALKPPRP